jgi:hypothetical protein
MPCRKLPPAATDPLYTGGKGHSRVEAHDIAEDIAWIQGRPRHSEKPEAKTLPNGSTYDPNFTDWLIRAKPR